GVGCWLTTRVVAHTTPRAAEVGAGPAPKLPRAPADDVKPDVRHVLRGPEVVTVGKHRALKMVAQLVHEGAPPIRREAYELGEGGLALQSLDEAAKGSRGDPGVRMERIDLLHAMGRLDDARQLLREAQTSAKGDASTLWALAMRATLLKMEREAIAIYEELT